MRPLISLACLFVALSPIVQAQSPSVAQTALEQNRVFEFRTAVIEAVTPQPFYKGALAVEANRIDVAVKELRSAIENEPNSEHAYQAHDLLGNMFLRNGRYQDAYQQIQAALKQRPESSDAKQTLPFAAALNSLPGMQVKSFRPSKLHLDVNSIFLPVQVNGHPAEFFFDTGAGISALGESEAKELGLVTRRLDGRMNDSSGLGISGLRIALAKNLSIGGLHLRNVPFIVLSDSGEPWKSLPVRRRGVIGIPVILAMKTLRWSRSGSFEFGFPSSAFNISACNVLFKNSNPVTDVQVEGKHLDFTVDTGAETTDLNPAFAAALPALVKAGILEKHSIEGIGGEVVNKSVLLPSIALQIGSFTAVLKPAHVFIEHGNGSWAAGNLGMDLLGQADAFTLDFDAMTLKMQQ